MVVEDRRRLAAGLVIYRQQIVGEFRVRRAFGPRHRVGLVGIAVAEPGIHQIDQMHVEPVEPHHRLLAEIAVVVPSPGWGDDEIAGRHHGPLARDRGIGVLALDDKAQRRGDVAVGGRDLARQDDLHAGEQAAGDAGFARHAGIFEHQHAALGFLGGDDLAGFHQIGSDIAPFPDRRHARTFRLLQHQIAQHPPQRREMLLIGAAIEFHAALFRLAVDGMRKAVIGHRSLLEKLPRRRPGCARIPA